MVIQVTGLCFNSFISLAGFGVWFDSVFALGVSAPVFCALDSVLIAVFRSFTFQLECSGITFLYTPFTLGGPALLEPRDTHDF